ncbi:DUF6392 family protein [Pseudomonas kurunegalensis]|uniref:DUF6392 family protein n=1 Tax=Pseudomonas kurunegalensis TaxID=485880 RepID=UPI002570ED15|nr:DUF6392 family protein [Pseudomonas kurunegalensis]WJD61549.1 DUF6392 family protein [Pseudomonas kurunegalensis]
MKEQLELLINNLGKSYHDLVKLGLIEKYSLRESQYEDCESFEIESIPGLELVFEPVACRFETVYIRLRDDTDCDLPVYSAPLPNPFSLITNRSDVCNHLGIPLASFEAKPIEGLPAYDTFQLDRNLHSAARLSLQYGADTKLNTIVISVFNTTV